MANENDTVEQVCEELVDCGAVEIAYRVSSAHKREIAAKNDERLTIAANYESVIAAKDRIIAAKDAEIARLKRESFGLIGDRLVEKDKVKKRDALIKELADALECAVSGFSKEVVTYGEAFALVKKAREVVKMRHEYCIMFRWKGTNEEFRVINWSVGSHRRAYQQMRSMQRDYRQYEYCMGVRLITNWMAA